MKDKTDGQTFRTKLPNFSHQLEHVGPNKQILDRYLLIPTRINLGYNAELTCFGNPPNLKGFQAKTMQKLGLLDPCLMEFGSE